MNMIDATASNNVFYVVVGIVVLASVVGHVGIVYMLGASDACDVPAHGAPDVDVHWVLMFFFLSVMVILQRLLLLLTLMLFPVMMMRMLLI